MDDSVIESFNRLPSNARPNSAPHPPAVHADEVELMPKDENVILKYFGPDIEAGSWNSKENRKEGN